MESGDKLEKFIRRIERMIDMLEEHHADQHIASNINQFYYVQKLEELKQFQESIQQTAERVRFFASQFESEYTLVYTRWKNDVRWLNTMRILSRKYAGGGPPYKGPADEDHTYG